MYTQSPATDGAAVVDICAVIVKGTSAVAVSASPRFSQAQLYFKSHLSYKLHWELKDQIVIFSNIFLVERWSEIVVREFIENYYHTSMVMLTLENVPITGMHT